ncbi:replication-relaxation family protein [Actinoplanes flavus]|uniref:Replication-relaxation family protein n=1 Tax=Actinoplanes flavus TaxID=2820290 RepID=A0ABS3UIG5_9ACTN|nr:replication-relaxation family protein [Actinoplanes flavus]MBO3738001.1 replication-relaxation family protein [Actinoplanes flavus]
MDLRGLRERHWRLLSLVAEHALLDSECAAELMFGSRPAAVRHLQALARAGLVWRFARDDDRTHRAFYEVSTNGVDALTARTRASGLPVPVNLGGAHRDQYVTNHVHVGLVRAAKASEGRAWLYSWHRGVEAAAGMRRLGISSVYPQAAGTWLENGRVLRFLLHVDDDRHSLSSEPPPAAQALAGYRLGRTGIPATALLVLASTAEREAELHRNLTAQPLPVPVAATTPQRLYALGDPSAKIWTPTSTEPGRLVRLIDVAPY